MTCLVDWNMDFVERLDVVVLALFIDAKDVVDLKLF